MRIVFALILSLFLVGCGEPIPMNQWNMETTNLSDVKNLEDCILVEIHRTTTANPIFVVRCSGSITTQYRTSGKNGYDINTTTVERKSGKTELSDKIEKLQKELDVLKKENR